MRIYPLFSKAMEEIFPIELVNEFELNFSNLVDIIANNDKQGQLSATTINKLKDFSFYLIKHSNFSTVELGEDFDFNTIINNSKKIALPSYTLLTLIQDLNEVKCSIKELYEILFICSRSTYSIFKNITPLTLPDENINKS